MLALHTMRFHDEVVEADDLDVRKPGKGPSKREVEMAGQLVESLHRKFDPEDYEDTYREAVLELIERKAKGEDIDARGARARGGARRPGRRPAGEPEGVLTCRARSGTARSRSASSTCRSA